VDLESSSGFYADATFVSLFMAWMLLMAQFKAQFKKPKPKACRA
jgi:hypothetical protein